MVGYVIHLHRQRVKWARINKEEKRTLKRLKKDFERGGRSRLRRLLAKEAGEE